MKLESAWDRDNEMYVRERLAAFTPAITWVNMPEFSAADLLGFSEGRVVNIVEVKTRKYSRIESERRYPSGLILKRRKLEELITLSDLTNLTALVLFAFEHGSGEILSCMPSTVGEKHNVETGRRDRDLATDREPVVLLDWTKDLRSFLPAQLSAS